MLNMCFSSAPCIRGLSSHTTFRSYCAHVHRNFYARAEAFEHTVKVALTDFKKQKKIRLDSFLAGKISDVSRGKIQASIAAGKVLLNNQLETRTSVNVKPGDFIQINLLPPQQLEAAPEAIPLDIIYEDAQVLVVNKPAGMVVHPSAGHSSGTLVNALLHHCGLPAMRPVLGSQPPLTGLSTAGRDTEAEALDPDDDNVEGVAGSDFEDEGAEVDDDGSGMLLMPASLPGGTGPILRPGIVHRIDKGTTGLLVMVKDELSHASLCKQFQLHTVDRVYWSLVLGVPETSSGSINTNIGRDPAERKRQAAFGYGSSRGRPATSTYQVEEVLAGGAAALVKWKLQTGRTHQIRVHAKHIKHPLLGDETYGGGAAPTVSRLSGNKPSRREAARQLVAALGRPALHAATLGFTHPLTMKRLNFETPLPADFAEALQKLRGWCS